MSVILTKHLNSETLSQWIETNDGRYMAAYVDTTNRHVMIGYCNSDIFLTTEYPIQNSVDTGIVLRNLVTNPVITKRADGKVLMVIKEGYKATYIGATLDCYISNSGNGNDFVYYSNITSPYRSGATSSESIAPGLNIFTTKTGRILVNSGLCWGYSYSADFLDGNYVYSSDDNGLTWTRRYAFESFYASQGTRQMAQIPDGTLFFTDNIAGAETRLFYSSDDGSTWSKINNWNSTFSYMMSMFYDEDIDNLYALINGQGIYYIEKPTFDKVIDKSNWKLIEYVYLNEYGHQPITHLGRGKWSIIDYSINGGKSTHIYMSIYIPVRPIRNASYIVTGQLEEPKYTWENANTAYSPIINTTDYHPSCVKLNDGRILYMYLRNGVIYQSFAPNLQTFMSQNNSVSGEQIVLSNLSSARATVFKSPNNELFFTVTYTKTSTENVARVQIYKSALGDGSDWKLYSTVNSYAWDGTTTALDNTNSLGSGLPTFINGRWILGHVKFTSFLDALISYASISTSDDNGITWTLRATYSFGPFAGAYIDNFSRNIAYYKGELWWSYNGTYYMGLISIVKSSDNGTTWTTALHSENLFDVGTNWWNNSMIADTENLYAINGDNTANIVRKSTIKPTTFNDFVDTGIRLPIGDVVQYDAYSIFTMIDDKLIGMSGSHSADSGNKVMSITVTKPKLSRIRNLKLISDNSAQEINYDWAGSTAWYRPFATLDGSLTIAKKNNGNMMCVLTQQGRAYEGECSVGSLLTTDGSVTTWSEIPISTNGGYYAVSKVGNKLYLNVSDKGDINGSRPASHKLYVSNSGNGGDWEYYSTISTFNRTGIDERNGNNSENMNGVGCITILPNGRWVIPCGFFNLIFEELGQNYGVFTSDDNGLTWIRRHTMYAYGFGGDYYEQGCPKHIATDTKGNLYVAWGANQGGLDIEFCRSSDNGSTWTQTWTEDTWGWVEYYANEFDMISNNKGGLYLFTVSDGAYNTIFELPTPDTIPSTKIKVKDLPYYNNDNEANTTMQEIDGRLYITKNNMILGLAIEKLNHVRSMKYKNINEDWIGITI